MIDPDELKPVWNGKYGDDCKYIDDKSDEFPTDLVREDGNLRGEKIINGVSPNSGKTKKITY